MYTIKQLIETEAYKDLGGVNKLQCNLCNGFYVGQSGRATNVRYKRTYTIYKDKLFNIRVCKTTSTNIGKRKHTTNIKNISERNTHDLLGGIVCANISSTESTDYQATG